jgi:hypothetical protein
MKKHADKSQDKSMAVKAAKTEVKAHEKRMHKKGGVVTRGNGAATKGTKAYGPMA